MAAVNLHGMRALPPQTARAGESPLFHSAVVRSAATWADIAWLRGRLPVLMDGGIRRGSDVFKALALGASAVFVGRPFVHGLAAAGAPGVAHVLHILRTELEITMALAGCGNLAAIDASRLFSP